MFIVCSFLRTMEQSMMHPNRLSMQKCALHLIDLFPFWYLIAKKDEKWESSFQSKMEEMLWLDFFKTFLASFPAQGFICDSNAFAKENQFRFYWPKARFCCVCFHLIQCCSDFYSMLEMTLSKLFPIPFPLVFWLNNILEQWFHHYLLRKIVDDNRLIFLSNQGLNSINGTK